VTGAWVDVLALGWKRARGALLSALSRCGLADGNMPELRAMRVRERFSVRLKLGASADERPQRAAARDSAPATSEESWWVSYLALKAAIASLSGGPVRPRISASSTK
jgi:hypothetical protein